MAHEQFQDDLYLDFDVELGMEKGNRAFFGRNVLQGLVDGIDDLSMSVRLVGSNARIG